MLQSPCREVVAHFRLIELTGTRGIRAVALAGHGAGAAVAVTRARGEGAWQCGPGLAAVERAPHIQVVAVAALGIEAPVGRPGVEEHHEVAVDEAAVALGDVQRVVPGLILHQVDELVFAVVAGAVNRRDVTAFLGNAFGRALMPGEYSRLVACALFHAIQVRAVLVLRHH